MKTTFLLPKDFSIWCMENGWSYYESDAAEGWGQPKSGEEVNLISDEELYQL